MNKLFNNKMLDLLIKPPAPIGNLKISKILME